MASSEENLQLLGDSQKIPAVKPVVWVAIGGLIKIEDKTEYTWGSPNNVNNSQVGGALVD